MDFKLYLMSKIPAGIVSIDEMDPPSATSTSNVAEKKQDWTLLNYDS